MTFRGRNSEVEDTCPRDPALPLLDWDQLSAKVIITCGIHSTWWLFLLVWGRQPWLPDCHSSCWATFSPCLLILKSNLGNQLLCGLPLENQRLGVLACQVQLGVLACRVQSSVLEQGWNTFPLEHGLEDAGRGNADRNRGAFSSVMTAAICHPFLLALWSYTSEFSDLWVLLLHDRGSYRAEESGPPNRII